MNIKSSMFVCVCVWGCVDTWTLESGKTNITIPTCISPISLFSPFFLLTLYDIYLSEQISLRNCKQNVVNKSTSRVWSTRGLCSQKF